MSMGQDDLKMAGGIQVIVPSNFSRALVLSSTKKSPTALKGHVSHFTKRQWQLKKMFCLNNNFKDSINAQKSQLTYCTIQYLASKSYWMGLVWIQSHHTQQGTISVCSHSRPEIQISTMYNVGLLKTTLRWENTHVSQPKVGFHDLIHFIL